MKKENSKKKQSNKYLRFTSAGLQMGITIYLGSYLGKWLDEKYPSDKNWFTIGFVLFAVAASLFNLIRQVNKLNEN